MNPKFNIMNAVICVFLLGIAASAHAADEIHYSVTGETSVTFDWRGTENTISYGTSSGNYTDTANAVTPDPLPTSSSGPFKEARITGLSPSTVYHYRIGNGADHTFRTAPTRGSSDFVVYAEGDVGSSLKSDQMIPVQELIAADLPSFVLLEGDLAYADDDAARVDQHFNDVMMWSQDAAYMPAWGNHDWDILESVEGQLNEFEGRVDFPNSQTSPGAEDAIGNGPGEDWYWFDYGNVRFIAYPEPFISDTWQDWSTEADLLMDAAQADTAIDYIVTFGHRPAYSSGNHGGNSTLQGIMASLGNSHSKYVLNLAGHSHDYERTFPQDGVVHLTVGTGGAGLQAVDSASCPWSVCPKPDSTAFRAIHHGVMRLHFTATGIAGSFICGPAQASKNDITCDSGEVVDSFSIGNPGSGSSISTLTFTPSADATILEDFPTNNTGNSTQLKADTTPGQQFLMRFTVSGVGTTHSVQSAKLRLRNINPSNFGGNFHRLADESECSAWSESGVDGVTWETAPLAGEIVASLGAVASGNWYEVDITPLITGDGTFCLRVDNSIDNGADYSSKEGDSADVPQLIVDLQ